MGKTLVAIFDDQSDAQQALEALVDKGFSTSNVRIASGESLEDAAEGRHTSRPDQEKSFGDKIANLFGFGDYDETYTEAVRRGSCVITVDAASDDDLERAEDIINGYEPVDIDEREAEWRESGWQASQEKAGGSTIPIVEEQVQIGKRAVQKGGVRVVSRVTKRPVEETVTLREEHATVKRRPVDRAVTESDTAFEEAVIGKTSRVVEEVVIGKESSTREQTIKDSVRKTDVQIEQLSQGSSARQSTSSRYTGVERRMNAGANYRGMERRAA